VLDQNLCFVTLRHALLKGALAQLGERRAGSAEVRGSIPLGSTTNMQQVQKCTCFFIPRVEGIEPMRWVSVEKTIDNRFQETG
jgi:hypothetical protein